jgi:hypothetical protein
VEAALALIAPADNPAAAVRPRVHPAAVAAAVAQRAAAEGLAVAVVDHAAVVAVEADDADLPFVLYSHRFDSRRFRL